ncbi:MAG: hypothetical protein ACRDTH_27945 [Pseudonocardiaceae bacterium]
MTATTESIPVQTASAQTPTWVELIAHSLSTTHVIDGHFVRMGATVDGGYIALDITRIEFQAEADTTVRVLLHLSEPITVTLGVPEPGA